MPEGVSAARYPVSALLTVIVALAPTSAIAETLNTAECRFALDDANRLMRGVEGRQMQFSRYDPAENCRLLRDNLEDLAAAREPLDRCLTGDDHTRSLGELDAAVGQIRGQLIANCRR